jgi:3-oxoacyl-[acyl-carrier protein] reductase
MKSGNGQGKNQPPLFNLSGKTAIVTGASGDIGYDIAVQLSRAGVSTAVLGRDQKRLERTAKDAQALGVKSTGYVCDVRNSDQVESTIRKILGTFDHIDILVNNAGTGSLGDISSVDENTWDTVIDTNLKSVFLFCKALLPQFRKQKFGRIINIASISAQTGGAAGSISYTASKGGVLSITKTLSRDLAPYGVTVNAVSPGVIDAGMGKLSAKDRAKFEPTIPIGRVGTGKDVAYAVLFLASDEAQYITGTTIDVNGGLLKR